jgi:hypothetical protein
MDRGLLFAGVLKGLEGIPYPIANTATIFLDDFPAPQYEILAEPIKSEMNLQPQILLKKYGGQICAIWLKNSKFRMLQC